MSTFALNLFAISDFSTDAVGFNSNNGSQFQNSVSTITFAPGATPVAVGVEDNDPDFNDDDSSQTLARDITIDGHDFAAGTMIESEYVLTLAGFAGQHLSPPGGQPAEQRVDDLGFVFQGTPPPAGEPLTVVAHQDMATQGVAYQTAASPACFAAGTLIDTEVGPQRVESLRPAVCCGWPMAAVPGCG